jgi:hypothetical protein
MKFKFVRTYFFIWLILLSFHVIAQDTLIGPKKASNNRKYIYESIRGDRFGDNPPITYVSISAHFGLLTKSMPQNKNTGAGFLLRFTGENKLRNENSFFVETGIMNFSEKETSEFSNTFNEPLLIMPINIGYLFQASKFKYGLSSGIAIVSSYNIESQNDFFKTPKFFNINPLIEYEYKHLLLGGYYTFIATNEPISYFGIKAGYKFKIKKGIKYIGDIKEKK